MLIFTRKQSDLATRFPYVKELAGFFSELKLVIKDKSFLISWVGNIFIVQVLAGEVRKLFPSHQDVFVPSPLLSKTRLCFGCSNVCPPASSWVLMSQPLPKWPLFILILPYKVNKHRQKINKQKHKKHTYGLRCNADWLTVDGTKAPPVTSSFWWIWKAKRGLDMNPLKIVQAKGCRI